MKIAVWALGIVVVATAAGGPAQRTEVAGREAGFACGERLMPFVQTSLFLDRGILGGAEPKKITERISDKRWKQFTREVLMREFPAGGTVFENSGWWRSPSGRMDSGEGYMVVVTSPVAEAAQHRAAAGRVVEEIRRHFRQESVLREEEVVCAAF